MNAATGRLDETLPTGAARWPLATRPGFLTITAVAGLLGIAAAFADGIAIAPAVAALALFGALLAHAGANVINDVHDAANGSDDANTDRIFPFTGGSRFIQQGIIDSAAMRRLALLLFAATAVCGLGLMLLSTPWLLAFGVGGLGLAWAYSAPPLQLMSRGFGEIAVAAGWLLVVAGMDFALRRQFAPTAWWVGGGLALLVTNILFINQFPDRRADAAAGKRNWVVRLGPERAARLYPAIAALAYVIAPIAVAAGRLPIAALAGLAAAPFSWQGWRILRDNAGQPARLAGAIRATLIAAHVHGLLLVSSLIIDRCLRS